MRQITLSQCIRKYNTK